MFIPSFFVDCCQGLIGNQTSWNNVIAEKKRLRINDEVILSEEFTADEMLDIQYKMGNMFEFLLNRKNYHHSPTSRLLILEARHANASLIMKLKNRSAGKIIYIYKSGNLRVEFNIDNKTEYFTISPLIITPMT